MKNDGLLALDGFCLLILIIFAPLSLVGLMCAVTAFIVLCIMWWAGFIE